MSCVRLLQVLPFAGEDTLRQLEVNLASVPSVTELLHQGLGPRDITARLLEGIGLSDVPSSSLCPRYCLAFFFSIAMADNHLLPYTTCACICVP